MAKINIVSVTPENPNSPYPLLDVSNVDNIETWYRNLGPNRDMRDIALVDSLDSIAGSILHLTHRELAATPKERINQLVMLTTDSAKLGRELALEGPKSLLAADMLLELVESKPDLPKSITLAALRVSQDLALGIRDNPITPLETRIQANSRAYNSALVGLAYGFNGIAGAEYSDRYIELIRGEARWMASQAKGAASGTLFESMVSSLAKYQIWASEEDQHLFGRSATLREDKPSRRVDGGNGHAFAHDVVIKSRAAQALLQCKFGPGANEESAKYDPEKITLITELNDDGLFNSQDQFIKVFNAIARSDKPENMEVCDQMIQRYGLDKIVKSLSEYTASSVGAIALDAASV